MALPLPSRWVGAAVAIDGSTLKIFCSSAEVEDDEYDEDVAPGEEDEEECEEEDEDEDVEEEDDVSGEVRTRACIDMSEAVI